MPHKDPERRRESGRERQRRYRDRHPELLDRHRTRARESTLRRTKEIKELLRSILGRACVACGERDTRILDFDHIYADGHIEKYSSGRIKGAYRSAYGKFCNGGSAAVRRCFQLLCRRCHQAKTLRVKRDRLESRGHVREQNPQLFDWATMACNRIDEILSPVVEG